MHAFPLRFLSHVRTTMEAALNSQRPTNLHTQCLLLLHTCLHVTSVSSLYYSLFSYLFSSKTFKCLLTWYSVQTLSICWIMFLITYYMLRNVTFWGGVILFMGLELSYKFLWWSKFKFTIISIYNFLTFGRI